MTAAEDAPWKRVVDEKRKKRDAIISKYLNIIPGNDVKDFAALIKGDHDASSLTSLIADGRATASSVTKVFIRRAIDAHLQTNCLTEPLFESALAQAQRLDNHFETTGKLVGPLHGIPFSLKDQFNIENVDTTLAYVGRSFQPAKRDAILAQVLKRLGGIIIAKTTIPQSILWGETQSPLWGLTTHPANSQLTPGGSSGGEAALLALKGSLCGWGTDIGGSIRGPAALCGLFGLKPTSTRFPYGGVPVSHEGQSHVPSTVGPMSSNLSTLVSVTKACLDSSMSSLDPSVVPLGWREHEFREVQERPLKIGLILDDGVVLPHPEIRELMRRIASTLQQAGHVIVPWDMSDHLACVHIQDQFYRADGGQDIIGETTATGEPLLPHVHSLVSSAQAISVFQYWQLNKRKVALQESYNVKWSATASGPAQSMAKDRSVDVVLSPVMPHTAVPHNAFRWSGYTKIWNFLDYTAASLAVGTFSKTETSADKTHSVGVSCTTQQEYAQAYKPRGEMDEWNQHLYDPEGMDGLPIGVQVIGRRFEEEKVLGFANVLNTLLKGS